MLKIKESTISGTLALEMLSLEAENSNNILGSSLNLLPSLVSELSGSMNSLIETAKSFNIVDLKALIRNNFLGVKDVPEDTLKKLFIPVPEGFIGKAIEYQASLGFCLDYYDEVTAKSLKEFYVRVAAFITNKDRKLSIKDDSNVFKQNEQSRTTLTKELTTYFNKGNTGRTLFHDVYDGYGDFKQASKTNGVLIKRLEKYDLKNIANQVKRIVDTLDLAIKSGKEGSYDKASNEALMGLANGTFELAQQIEFFAVTIYRIKALAFSISETDSKIKAL